MNKKYLLLLAFNVLFFAKTESGWCANESDFVFTRSIPTGIKSKSANDSTKVRHKIRNATNRFLDFRWINYDGNLELVRPKADLGFESIGPNNFLQGETYIGHPLVIIDPTSGKLLGCCIFNKTGDYSLAIQETLFGFELVQENKK